MIDLETVMTSPEVLKLKSLNRCNDFIMFFIDLLLITSEQGRIDCSESTSLLAQRLNRRNNRVKPMVDNLLNLGLLEENGTGLKVSNYNQFVCRIGGNTVTIRQENSDNESVNTDNSLKMAALEDNENNLEDQNNDNVVCRIGVNTAETQQKPEQGHKQVSERKVKDRKKAANEKSDINNINTSNGIGIRAKILRDKELIPSTRIKQESCQNNEQQELFETKKLNPKDQKLAELKQDESLVQTYECFCTMVVSNMPKARVPNKDSPDLNWLTILGRMHRLDGHPYQELQSMIHFLDGHDFWDSVVASPSSFRKHYHKIHKQWEKQGGNHARNADSNQGTEEKHHYGRIPGTACEWIVDEVSDEN